MPYRIYSTGWAKHYNTLYPCYYVLTLKEAVSYMRELLSEGHAVKMFNKSIDVDNYKVINYKNKRVIRRK
jgi:hypothetical protein